MDDISTHAKGERPHLDALDEFLGFLAKNDILLNVKKAVLVAPKIVFCGRKILKNGVTFSPKGLEALKISNLRRPQTGADLYQLIGALGWMRKHIPNFSTKIASLQDLLKSVLSQNPSKTKRMTSKISLKPLWEQRHHKAFRDIIDRIKNQMTIALLDPSKTNCVFTDASDMSYKGVVT